jgi:pimeloyl-ACP methyl ester carboxylesterase
MPAASRTFTRRALLLGGAAAVVAVGSGVAVETGLLPGRTTMHAVLGLNGPPGVIPDIAAGPFVHGAFTSAWRSGSTSWAVSYPPGSSVDASLPVLISLHGVRGDSAQTFGDYLGLDRFLAAAVADGASPFAIAAIDGGNSYWHARKSGEDASRTVIDEFLPLLAERGLLTDRVALFGWSMGGFGALDIARTLGSRRVAAVIAESPALWESAERTPAGVFDDPADFAAHTTFGHQVALDGIAVRIDCGTGDGFLPAAQKYVAGFSSPPAGSFEPGGHDPGYWRRMAPAQLAFAAEHLAR